MRARGLGLRIAAARDVTAALRHASTRAPFQGRPCLPATGFLKLVTFIKPILQAKLRIADERTRTKSLQNTKLKILFQIEVTIELAKT